MKIIKYGEINRLYFRKVFQPAWASLYHCRNHGMMFMDSLTYIGMDIPFRNFIGTKDMNRKRHMKKKWKDFFRSGCRVPAILRRNPMWWNGCDE